ncbi:nuclear inhibitor of protein phosphatase 1 [Folsomia candida]|uniref:Nuclear inhibitor of protein phosphatase 1 n=1 Tax=Folsomia candida TaxID=158441 RepID=A0A226F0W6_FOLCA|nr:nuclear inhibitor of protein phosphatase 1 [Folsomia candida]OXA63419.1 Nuclear inhibitor of protein phosphatase 1 [Folsomia candida]
MSNPHYDIPPWASRPAAGLHLDVMKGEKLVQKLMVDEKKCYLFGRNPQINDVCIDHASCSRVHAAFVYHKHLERAFLVDLASTHGTYIGSMRLESNKPTQLPVDTTFHFGASTRMYILREKPPNVGPRPIMEELERAGADGEGGWLGLPETDSELDNLTEFNTVHNKRISMLGIPEDTKRKKRKQKSVTFNEDEEIINPEDVDPSVGRFRNLVHTTVIPTSKRIKMDPGGLVPAHTTQKHLMPRTSFSLYDDLPPDSFGTPFFTSLSSKLDLPLPNPAPDIEPAEEIPSLPMKVMPTFNPPPPSMDLSDEPKKKKYAKEAWPGKKPGVGNLLL